MAADSQVNEQLDRLFDLSEILLDPDEGFVRRLTGALDRGSEHFDLPCGFLTHIDPVADRQEIVLASGTAGDLREGDTAPLSESYCRKTVESDSGTYTVADAEAEGWTDDPAYRRFGLESYVGSAFELDGDRCGTLCFAGSAPLRDRPRDGDLRLVELLSQWAEYELAVRTGRDGAGSGNGLLASFADSVTSEAIDDALDVLSHRTRRELLSYLASTGGSVPVDEAAAYLSNSGGVGGQPADRLEIALVHTHVPKLVDAGAVAYDDRTDELDYRSDRVLDSLLETVQPLEG